MSKSFDTIYSLRKRNLIVQGGKRKKPASGYSDILLTSSRGLDTTLSSSIPRQIEQPIEPGSLQMWINYDGSPLVSPGPITYGQYQNSIRFLIGNTNSSRISIVDLNGNLIQEIIPPADLVTPFFNGGSPQGIRAGSGGSFQFSDRKKNCVYSFDNNTSTITTLIGSTTGAAGFSDGLSGTLSLLSGPANIKSVPGGFVIAQAENHCISYYHFTSRRLTTVAGWGGIPGYLDSATGGTGARFNTPIDVFWDNSPSTNVYDTTEDIVIIDTVNNRIRKVQFKPNDWYFSGGGPLREDVIGPVTTIAGSGQPGSSDGPALSATFNKLIAGCCNNLNGDYYVADNGNLIRKISNGIVSTILGPSNGLAKVISLVCVNNILYISDMGSQTRPAAIYRYGV